MQNHRLCVENDGILGLPTEIVRKLAVFLCPTDVVLASRTCSRIHQIVSDPGFVAGYIPLHHLNASRESPERSIRTLEQLAFSQSLEVRELYQENRIGFPMATVEIAPDHNIFSTPLLLADPENVNVQNSITRIGQIKSLMRRHHAGNLSVRIDAHCGTLAPDMVASGFAVARAEAVREALAADATIPAVPIRTVGWAKMKANWFAEPTCDHKFGALARTGVGWAEVYLELDGWNCPPRPSCYDDVHSDGDDTEGAP